MSFVRLLQHVDKGPKKKMSMCHKGYCYISVLPKHANKLTGPRVKCMHNQFAQTKHNPSGNGPYQSDAQNILKQKMTCLTLTWAGKNFLTGKNAYMAGFLTEKHRKSHTNINIFFIYHQLVYIFIYFLTNLKN